MRVLLTGANGFLGGYLLSALGAAGHEVVAAVRDTVRFNRQWPHCGAVRCDMERDLTVADWLPRLQDIDAVINAAGILQGRSEAQARRIHAEAPIALFDACVRAGVRRVIQISALGVEIDGKTAYERTKAEADGHLATLELDWAVLRPSLIYGAGAYGGTAMFRAMAALPWITPVAGDGGQTFQPIHMDDLTRAVVHLLEPDAPVRQVIEAVGPEDRTHREILAALRRWMGLRPARVLRVPKALCRWSARLGDALGGGPLTSTAYHMLEKSTSGDPDTFARTIGFTPVNLEAGLARSPAQT